MLGGIRVKQHDFQESLSKSEKNNQWFEPFYRQVWSNLKGIHYVRNINWQKKGIDVRIDFSFGWTGIEEKLRYSWYPDIALEYLSSAEDKTHGWIEKDHVATWLAYGWKPVDRMLLIELSSLQRKWAENKESWLERHYVSDAANDGYEGRGYTTKCCCVPIRECLSGVPHTWWGAYDFWSPWND